MKLSHPPNLSIGTMPPARQPPERLDSEIPILAAPIEPEVPAVDNDGASPPAPQQRWWLTLAILAVLAGGGYLFFPQIKGLFVTQRTEAVAPPARVVPVVTAPVRRETMKVYLNGLGTVTGHKTITIRSRVEGELMKVAFTEGEMVKQGSLIARIDPRPFEVQLDQAKARLAEAEAALQKATHSQSREMAYAQLALDESQLRLAREEENRLSKLVATRAITADDWDRAVANRQKCEAQVQATKASLKQTEADYGTNILSAEANVAAAKTAVRNADIELGYCEIKSPVTGRIGLRYVDEGNIIRPNDPNGLAVITQLQPISVVFTVPQDDIAPVQKKMIAGDKLQVDAFDRNFQNKLASGTLEAIDNQVDVTTGTVRMKAEFTNEDNLLFPNQFVNARLLVETLEQVVAVPSAAVQRGPDMNYAYVVLPDSTVDLRTIVPGDTDGDLTAIESGLSPGETVVIDGVDKLHKGSKIAARTLSNPSAPMDSKQQASEITESDKKGT